jgi:hypothetical protein
MATQWYYESNGTVHGPVGSSEIRTLAASGEIHPTTRVREAGRDDWITARRLRGLFPDASTSIAQDSPAAGRQNDREWYLRDIAGKTFGPLTKAQLDKLHSNDQISTACQLRHKNSNEWQDAAELYPSLKEGTLDWQQVRTRASKVSTLARQHIQGYFTGLTIRWSPADPQLRRCVVDAHHQFASPGPCLQCGRTTVGLDVAQVASGDDVHQQLLYTIWKNSKRVLSQLLTWSLVICALLSIGLIVTTWWFLVFVPLAWIFGLAIPAFASRYLNRRIRRNIEGGSGETRQSISAEKIDEIDDGFVAPFLRRNEVPIGTVPDQNAFLIRRLKSLQEETGVLIEQKELRMLEQVLASQGLSLWTDVDSAQLVLSSFALKKDYALFKQRVEQLEAAGMSILAAYASLVRNDDTMLPLLQQLLTERGMPEGKSSLLAAITKVRDEFDLHGFTKDLEQRRHGSMVITIEMVDKVDPYSFELLLGMIYETQGFHVIETPKSGDQGADVLIEKAGERTVIQAKLYADSVGNKAVQEAIAARTHFRCHAAQVVTNSTFTPSAKQLAASSDVRLVDRNELTLLIHEFNRVAKDYGRLATLMNTSSILESPK